MPAKSIDILVAGEVNPDLILAGDVVPEFGQVEKLVDQAALAIGSSSAIFACGAARLGLRVAITGKVGADVFGQFMQAALAERSVDTSALIVDPHLQTGLSVILARGSDRAILTFPGAIPSLRVSDIRHDLLAQARHLHVASYFMQDALRPDLPGLFELAQQRGLTTSLDTNWDPSGRWDGGLHQVLPHTDVFLPNAAEAAALAGVDHLDEALRVLSAQARLVAVKLGAQGAVLRQGQQILRAASIPVKVADTVGAGDSFDAGFLYGCLQGWPLERALRLACVCGALSTRAPGGTTSQPTLKEAGQYL